MPPSTEAEPLDDDADSALVSRTLGGDTRAFELLMRRNNRRLYRCVRAILRDEAEIEDVMQQAYVNAFTHLSSFNGRARVSTWLARIAVHEALARARRARRISSLDDTRVEGLAMTTRSNINNPEQSLNNDELRALLERAIDALPEHYRAVFVLRAVDEMSVEEAAEALDLTEQAVKTRLFRARALLREALLERIDAAATQAFEFHLSRCDRVVAEVLGRVGALQ